MTKNEILTRPTLKKVSKVQGSDNTYKAKCPAHDDGGRGLTLTFDGEKLVSMECEAGCPSDDIGIALFRLPEDEVKPREAVGHNPTRKYKHTDIGAGDMFVDFYGDSVCYVNQQGTWYVWDGKRWREDTREQVRELAKDVSRKVMPMLADCIEDDTERATWLEWAKKLQSNRARDDMLKAARSNPTIAADLSDFDNDSRYINMQNGVLDLKDQKLIPHDKDLMLSKIAGCSYDPAAKCERWTKFTYEVMDGYVDVVKFLQKATGYALAGLPLEDCLFILYGNKTRNGKSTYCRSVINVLGDYAKTAQPETIAINRNKSGSGPSSDIARLRGARFVNMPEPSKSMELDAALVKQITGRDPITTRYMHKEFFEFIPQFVMFMNTNYLPRIDDMTLFSSGRIYSIPFPVHFPPDKQDRGLMEQFSEPEAASAIFNWILEGYIAYQNDGLKSNVPDIVVQAIKEYCESSDTFGQFLRDCIVDCENDWTNSTAIYRVYEGWAKENGYKAMSTKSMVSEMKRRGYKDKRRNSAKGFADITLEKTIPVDFHHSEDRDDAG